MKDEIIKSALIDMGCKNIKSCPKYFQSNAAYRGGDNDSALIVYRGSGFFKDFVTNTTGSFQDLVQLAKLDPNQYNLKSEHISTPQLQPNEKIQIEKIYPEECLIRLLPQYELFLKRNISKETLTTFKVGMGHSGKLFNRCITPIYNLDNKIIGFTGRWYQEQPPNEKTPKYLHIGQKLKWLFPCHLNKDIINKQREVILVESPACIFGLWECGIRNAMCLFGLKLSNSLLNYLISFGNIKIIIATNNEDSQRGNDAAKQVKAKLCKFFDKSNVIIHLPPSPHKDFGEIVQKNNKENALQILQKWYNGIQLLNEK